MKLDRLKGLLLQEFYITLRSYEVILDIFVFPIMSVIVFGFLANYLSGKTDASIAYSLLSGMLFWNVIFIIEYSVSVGSLWNIWSSNITNMFVAPISTFEYISSYIISGIMKALLLFILGSFVSAMIFRFNILSLGTINLIVFFINQLFFAVSFGMIILGLIFRYGTRIQAFAWGLLPIFQPLTATFFPVSVLPEPFRTISWILPPTYVFEAMRASLAGSVVRWDLIGISFAENIAFFVIAVWFFNYMFRKSKQAGQFVRLES